MRTEKRLDGSIAVRFRDQYLPVTFCAEAPKRAAPAQPKQVPQARRKARKANGNNGWMEGFWEQPGPTLRKAIEISNATS